MRLRGKRILLVAGAEVRVASALVLLRIVRQILRDEERRCFVRQLNIAMRTDFKVAVTFTSLEISGENRVSFFLRRAVGRDASAPWEEQAPAGCVLVLSSVVRSRRLRKRVPVPARKFLRWDKGKVFITSRYCTLVPAVLFERNFVRV